jgi:3-oxoacyl-[acyl-carrier protein] reductase
MGDQPRALITGGSRGIGAGISKKLAQEGYYVYINYSSNQAKAEEVLGGIKSKGGMGEIIRFDVSNSDEVTSVFTSIKKSGPALSVLVNNAGISIDGLLLRLKEEDLDRTLSVDLKGAIFCTREAAKQMLKARSGSIVQISSVVGEMGNGGQAAYSAAKAGLIGFSKSAAKELASRGIRVNVITPGFITTDMTEALTQPQKEAIVQTIPLGDLGTPKDVANLVAFLASEDSRYITGQVIGVNGGMYM